MTEPDDALTECELAMRAWEQYKAVENAQRNAEDRRYIISAIVIGCISIAALVLEMMT